MSSPNEIYLNCYNCSTRALSRIQVHWVPCTDRECCVTAGTRMLVFCVVSQPELLITMSLKPFLATITPLCLCFPTSSCSIIPPLPFTLHPLPCYLLLVPSLLLEDAAPPLASHQEFFVHLEFTSRLPASLPLALAVSHLHFQ